MAARASRPAWWQLAAALALLAVLCGCGGDAIDPATSGGATSGAGADEPPGVVQLATLEWVPWVGRDLPGEGISTAVVRAAFAETGVPRVEVRYRPWPRTLKEGRLGQVDAIYPAYHSPERERDFLFSRPILAAPLVLVRHAEVPLAFDGDLEALRGLRIGVVRGYVNTPAFDAADFLDKQETTTDRSNLQKLARRHVDAIVIDELTARTLIARHLPEEAATFVFVRPPLQVKLLYVAFSRAVDGADAARDRFDAAFEALRQRGALQQIMRRHGAEELIDLLDK